MNAYMFVKGSSNTYGTRVHLCKLLVES